MRAWNRTPRADAGTTGHRLCASAPEAIDGSDLVITMLPDLVDVQQVVGGLLGPGALVAVMGTVSPVGVRRWAEEQSAAGVGVVDAPVSGGDVGAVDGTLSIMVGGTPEAVDRFRPSFEAMGSVVRHLGPVGSGQLAKACNQIIVAGTLTALAEAVALGARGGLDVTELLDALAGGLAGSRALDVKRGKIEGHDFTPGGTAAFQHKDLGFALEAARAEGIALPMTAVVDQLFGAMRWTGHGGDDHSGILQMIERLSTEG